MLELKPRPIVTTSRTRRGFQDKQPRRLMLALALLLIALVAVIVRDRQFWFPSDDASIDSDVTAPEVAHPTKAAPTPDHQAKSLPAPAAKKPATAAKSAAAPKVANATTPASGTVTGTRTVLPPLDVEVVAGDNHRTLHPGSNTTKVEITNPGAAVTSAADRERMSTGPGPSQASYEASYPLLAQHMNVQGSVVLQAVIGSDGIIQNLHVLTGPAILVSAAQQAVREWRFKPVLQNGQPVETKAKITVNFSIRVADNTAKTTLAESRASDSLTITR